jgi:hypothetical protein
MDGVGVIVAQLMLPMAQEDMAREKERLSSSEHRDPSATERGMDTLLRATRDVVDLVRAGLRTQSARLQLREGLEDLQTAGFRVIKLAPEQGDAGKARGSLDSLMSASISLQAQLDEVEAIDRVNAIWFSPRRLLIAGALLLGLRVLLSGAFTLALIAIVAGAAAWRYRLLMVASSALQAKAQTLVRLCEKTKGSKNGTSPESADSAKSSRLNR